MAREKGMKAFQVFGDAELRGIEHARPGSDRELRQCCGEEVQARAAVGSGRPWPANAGAGTTPDRVP